MNSDLQDINVQEDCQFSVNFSVINSQNREINYIQEGSILRTQKIEQNCGAEITINLNQIKCLQWQGQKGSENQKVGKWIPYWKMEGLPFGGFYDKQGLKQGIWKDLDEQFQDYAQITFCGEYKDSKRIGRWDIIFNNKIIGGGYYDENGQKSRKWVELHQNYLSKSLYYCNIFHIGEYSEGNKVGYWLEFEINRQMGGGLYNQNGLKNGNWMELCEYFEKQSQVKYNGNYENGKKLGIWQILFKDPYKNRKFKSIGGGNYNINGLKEGEWIDISEQFNVSHQITYNGQYKNSKRQGHWDIMYKEEGSNLFEQIGGGSFDMNGMKDGIWVELSNQYFKGMLITFKGEYKNGQKCGNWDIFLKNIYADDEEFIGGGLYDMMGLKSGYWIELNQDSQKSNLITLNGEYISGIKHGDWATMLQTFLLPNKFQQIGGGSFNQFGMKDGKWIEINSNFSIRNQIIQTGNYKNGKKCGKWDRLIKNPQSKMFEKIGGGQFDVNGIKYGLWVEMDDEANLYNCITNKGEYINGKKSGNWIISHSDQNLKFKKIGGGQYDKNGMKDGKWIDIINDFKQCNQEIYSGIYKQGLKCGIWEEKSIKQKINKKIIYNTKGLQFV
ncbi:unnamed protein product [Paramecium pentaurelia]|uniref:Uncharacterized protein n=1 Tax=Paramecium pentaurelia TaxID=43138 RepID=A0A8S1X4D6_9CILI|nr:unnamed protein product [Paramecium pentaurelia]